MDPVCLPVLRGQWGLAVHPALGEDWGGSSLFRGVDTQPPCTLGNVIVQRPGTTLCTFSQRMHAPVFRVGTLAKVCLRGLCFDLVSFEVLPPWAEGTWLSASCGPVTFSQQMGPLAEVVLQLGHPLIASGPHLQAAQGPSSSVLPGHLLAYSIQSSLWLAPGVFIRTPFSRPQTQGWLLTLSFV